MHDPKFKEHNEQLKQAHKHLLYDVIPGLYQLLIIHHYVFLIGLILIVFFFFFFFFFSAFAKQFLKILEKKSPKDVSVAREMHTRGINLRFFENQKTKAQPKTRKRSEFYHHRVSI